MKSRKLGSDLDVGLLARKANPAAARPFSTARLLAGATVIVAHLMAAPAAPQLKPGIVIDMARLGYTEMPTASNREFFAHATPDVLSALDGMTRLVLVSARVLLLHAPRPDVGDKPWRTSLIRAFFVDSVSGALIRQHSWRTRPRTSPSEQVDSEARIFPVNNGRYIVSAQDELSLFSEDGEPLTKYKLPAGVPSSVTVTPDRSHVVLGSRGAGSEVVYQWLSSDALQVEKQLSHAEPPLRAVGSASAFSAVADGLVFRRSDGFHHISLDGMDRLFCSEAVCQNVNPHPIFSNGPVTAGRVAFFD